MYLISFKYNIYMHNFTPLLEDCDKALLLVTKSLHVKSPINYNDFFYNFVFYLHPSQQNNVPLCECKIKISPITIFSRKVWCQGKFVLIVVIIKQLHTTMQSALSQG